MIPMLAHTSFGSIIKKKSLQVYGGQLILHLRFSSQVPGGGGFLWLPNGELVGDCSGGSANNDTSISKT